MLTGVLSDFYGWLPFSVAMTEMWTEEWGLGEFC